MRSRYFCIMRSTFLMCGSSGSRRLFSSQRRSRFPSSFLSSGRSRTRSTSSTLPAYVWLPAVGVTGTLVYGYFAFLDEAPLTKRKRWIATSPAWECQLGDQEYNKLVQQFRGKILPLQHPASQTVHRVGERLIEASRAFAQTHPSANLSASPYTFTVVRSDMVNAFVLPNNHVFVMTGLFQYVRDEDDLAAVLGHEMAHNLARHAGEKMSGSIVVNIAARLLFLVDPSGVLTSLLLPAAQLLRELPNSRQAETEADQIGVSLAAHACYDPRAAKRVFAAMKEGSKGEPPEFMSTHPSHDRRISSFDDWMPSALQVFESDAGERCRQVRQDMRAARVVAAQSRAQRQEQHQEQWS